MVKFGVDVGGTAVKIGLFSEHGELIEKCKIPTDKSDSGMHIIDDIVAALKDILAKRQMDFSDCSGVGVGLPGPVDSEGNILGCVNLGWDIFNVEQAFSEKMEGTRVKAGNDANVAALGEMTAGAGRGYRNLVMVTLGTGVGGGVILGGRILEGTNGAAGEIGHLPVEEEETDVCNCGKKGCLEQYASATGLVRMANQMKKDYPNTILTEEVTAKDICDGAKTGDELCVKVVRRMGRYLGIGLASVACVVNPECFVIGGGVSNAGKLLLDEVQEDFATHVFKPCKNVEFKLAELGNDAGIYGAAALI